MFTNKPFQIALIISLITHTAIFLRLPAIDILSKKIVPQEVKMIYIYEKTTIASSGAPNNSISKIPLQLNSDKKIAPAHEIRKESIFDRLKNIQPSKPEFARTEIIAVKKKITLPLITNEKITNPEYINYYQTIREKIKRSAYKNYNRLINGEVYLAFIILNNGELKDIRVDEEKSTAHIYLKDISKKTIYDASPFPGFPKELDYPELSFNLIISFEVE